MFQYDVLKDILLISLLNQVEFTLLEDVEETTKYDYGRLNYTVTKRYLVIILIISEMLRIGYIQNCLDLMDYILVLLKTFIFK